jgi:hypothetical protein
MQSRLLVLRRPATHLPVGATAWWDGQARTVTCATCHETNAEPARAWPAPVELERGQMSCSRPPWRRSQPIEVVSGGREAPQPRGLAAGQASFLPSNRACGSPPHPAQAFTRQATKPCGFSRLSHSDLVGVSVVDEPRRCLEAAGGMQGSGCRQRLPAEAAPDGPM